MGKIYKTARGRSLDMASLISKHEKTRAVSNINQVNARGDEIDANGQVIRTAGDKVADSYASQVGSQTAQARPEHPDLSPSANPNAPLSPKQLRELDAFREMSAEKSNPISPYVEGQLFGRGQVKWAHDTMNIWEAYQILSEIINDPNSVRNQISGPPPWDYHRYLTVNKYTIDDIYNKKFGEDGFHQLSDKDLDDHVNFISEYIDKKLNKR